MFFSKIPRCVPNSLIRQNTCLPRRYVMTASSVRAEKREGDISAVFASLSGEGEKTLPDRYLQMKKEIIGNNHEKVQKSWDRLVETLKEEIQELVTLREKAIPVIHFEDATGGHTNKDQISEIHRRGCAVIKGVFLKEEALDFKQKTKDYIQENIKLTKGYPANDPQVWEIYWSPAQIKARAHPRMLAAQRFLQQLWTDTSSSPVDSSVPLTYVDRLRIRSPGDKSFALGPHVDGGSVERWEDPEYRACYRQIFEGEWEKYNPFDSAHRTGAVMDMYNGAGSCAAFREFQGWLSLSNCGPGEGTLMVNPLLKSATAYFLLRPFFSPPTNDISNLNNWKLDLSNTQLHGAAQGRGQEFSEKLHPHLQLDRSVVSMPKLEPGDFVVWHCDMIHAVDPVHGGKEDASVFYIPVVPKCEMNDKYLVQQKENFLKGVPAPDFPGGKGETSHVGRATKQDIYEAGGQNGLTAMGFI